MNNLSELFQNQTFRNQVETLRDALFAVIVNFSTCLYKVIFATAKDIISGVGRVKNTKLFNSLVQGNFRFSQKTEPKEEETQTLEQDEPEVQFPEKEETQTLEHAESGEQSKPKSPDHYAFRVAVEQEEKYEPKGKESVKAAIKEIYEKPVPILNGLDLPPSKLDEDLEEYLNINSCYAAAEEEDSSLYRKPNLLAKNIIKRHDLRNCLVKYQEIVMDRVTGEFLGDCLGTLDNPPDITEWTQKEWDTYGVELEAEEIDLVGYDEEAYHEFRKSLEGTIKELRQSLGLTDDNHPFDHSYILDCIRFIDPVFHQKYLIPYYNLSYNKK